MTHPAIHKNNPLPQLLAVRLSKVAQRLEAGIYSRHEPIAVEIADTDDSRVEPAEASSLRYRPIEPDAFFGPPWGGWSRQWFRLRVPDARPEDRGRRHLLWDCQGETTAYRVDGEDLTPWAGLDNAHATCPLPDEACDLYLACGCWQTGIWAPTTPIQPEGLRFRSAKLAIRDLDAWSAWCDVDVLLDLLNELLVREGLPASDHVIGYQSVHEKVPVALRRTLVCVEQVCDAYAAGGAGEVAQAAAAAFETMRGGGEHGTANLVGHAHIDMVWLWPEWVADDKAVHSFATVCRLLERYPEMRFTQSMPAIYRRLAEKSPASLSQIEAAREKGQWEVTGAFEVEPDVTLPCGEALVRSIEVGQRHAESINGGVPAKVCWLPDVFGYCRCLPQILALSGVDRFFTTKMHWSAVTRFPYNSFVWQGPDGESEILAHLSPIGYNGECKISDHTKALAYHRQAGVHDQVLVGTGFGDGGGGPTERMCERARRQADLAGVPRSEWTTADAFFDRLDQHRDRLPRYEGELYLEYHRGTYTNQSEHKRLYRRLERALQAHEAARTAAALGPWDDEEHDRRWRRLLFAQFHDAIPGSSIRLVYQQLNPELESAAEREIADATAALGGAGDCLFNPLPMPARHVVERDGRPALLTLGPLESRSTAEAEFPSAASAVEASPLKLSNGVLTASFTDAGGLESLTIDGRDLDLRDAGLRLYHDDPGCFDAWDIDHYTLSTARPVPPGPLRVEHQDATQAVLVSEPVHLPDDCGTVVLRYRLDADSRYLHIEVHADWSGRQRLLKYHFATGYRGRFARFGTPFGAVSRPQVPGVEQDEAMWEVPGSRWAAVTDDAGEGLAVLTRAKYGFSVRSGDLGLSLLRSASYPGGDGRATEQDAGIGGELVADLGEHKLAFAVGRHEPQWRGEVASTASAADLLFHQPLPAARPLSPPFEFLQLAGLTPAWVRPEPNGGWTLRLHDTAGTAGVLKLRVHRPESVSSLDQCDLRGRTLQNHPPDAEGVWNIQHRPYAVLSLRALPG